MRSALQVRRLGPGDEALLALLDREDAAFDAPGRGAPRGTLVAGAAAAYLADPHVFHLIAEDGGEPVGHLLCHVQRRRRGDPLQVLLYEIGVREDRRRRGIGRALLDGLDAWMAAAGVRAVWVLADNPGAEAFYRACAFVREPEQPVLMTRER